MKKIITILLLLFQLKLVVAQQDPMISQYMFNGLFINPAYSGSHKYFTSSLLHRNQWLDFPGAPKTLLFAVDGLVPSKSENMGVGLIVVNDCIGSTEQTDIYGNYAYQLKLKKGKLALGIKAGVSNHVFKNNATVWDENDVNFSTTRSNWLPKFGFGVYYFCDNWYAGLSVPTLLAYDVNKSFSVDVNEATFLNRHYYAYGGYVIKLNDQLKLKPSGLIKYVPSAPVEADINLHLLYKDQFWIGTGYRTNDAVVFMLEYQTNVRFRVGYAYDLTLTKIRNYSNGSHEIMIGYDFGKDLIKVKTPRYF